MRRFAALLLFVSLPLMAAKTVVLTIDDLPYVGNTHHHPGKLRRENKRFNTILKTLKEKKISVVGFVVAGSIEPGQWELLQKFQQAGHVIANHTYDHVNLNATSAQHFIHSIAKADETLKPLMTGIKYFRYPYLAAGNSEHKRRSVYDYLVSQHYVIVPVTIDSKDFDFNLRLHSIPWRQRQHHLGRLRANYLATIRRNVRKAERRYGTNITQILLIHMNTINAYFLANVIDQFRAQGYSFVPLTPDVVARLHKPSLSVQKTSAVINRLYP